jgi:hypothetical protein
MGKIVFILFFLLLGKCHDVYGQNMGSQAENESKKKSIYGEYSRWTIGAFFGVPFTDGNLSSFSADKTYWGSAGSLVFGYQMNPVLGFDLSYEMGLSKLGSPDYAKEYILGPDGMTYYPPTTISGTLYSDLYSKVNFFQFGFGLNLNLNHLFMELRGPRIFTVLLQPKIYAQHFSSSVRAISNDQEVTGSPNGKSLNLGLGGDIALRARISASFDAQLSTGITWIENDFFEGVKTEAKAKDSYMIGVKIGLIYKFNSAKKSHKDNLLYAPSGTYVRYMKAQKDISVRDERINSLAAENKELKEKLLKNKY